MNPIENLRHELNECIGREVKQRTNDELVDGNRFWETVTIKKYNKYMNDLNKVIPRVSELNGEPTGY